MPDSPRLRSLRDLLADDPADPFLHYGVAMELSSLGDDAGAVAKYRELIQLKPDYVPAYLMLAQTLQKVGKTDDAIPVLKTGVETAKKVGDLHAMGELQGLLDALE